MSDTRYTRKRYIGPVVFVRPGRIEEEYGINRNLLMSESAIRMSDYIHGRLVAEAVRKYAPTFHSLHSL